MTWPKNVKLYNLKNKKELPDEKEKLETDSSI